MTTANVPLAEHLDRRTFLASSAGAAVAFSGAVPLLSTNAANSAPMNEIPIIDTHQHLWDIQKFKLAWLSTAPELARNFVTRDYLGRREGAPRRQSRVHGSGRRSVAASRRGGTSDRTEPHAGETSRSAPSSRAAGRATDSPPTSAVTATTT